MHNQNRKLSTLEKKWNVMFQQLLQRNVNILLLKLVVLTNNYLTSQILIRKGPKDVEQKLVVLLPSLVLCIDQRPI